MNPNSKLSFDHLIATLDFKQQANKLDNEEFWGWISRLRTKGVPRQDIMNLLSGKYSKIDTSIQTFNALKIQINEIIEQRINNGNNDNNDNNNTDQRPEIMVRSLDQILSKEIIAEISTFFTLKMWYNCCCVNINLFVTINQQKRLSALQFPANNNR